MPAPELAKRKLTALAVFCTLLVAQGAYSFAIEPEPYPAVRMPSFGAAPSRSGLFPSQMVHITVTYKDGTIRTPKVSEIMDGVRFSATRPSLTFAFKPGKPIDEVTRGWLRDNAKAIGTGREPAFVEICWQDASVDVRNAEVVNAKPCVTTVVSF